MLVEELLKATRAINANPGFAVEERKRLGLLKDLPEKMEAEVLPVLPGRACRAASSRQTAAASARPPTTSSSFALAGQIKGDGVKAGRLLVTSARSRRRWGGVGS